METGTVATWKKLTEMSTGEKLVIERVRLTESGIAIEGSFELPPVAQLSLEDQIFVSEFVKSHGSIKEMERLFGVSYPTIKNRLNKISAELAGDYTVETNPGPSRSEVLDRLERGEITAAQAAEALKK
jgi:hypothetical protein